ncbi:hypothetical protein [Mameliella sp.]|uniref:hypothetical protein n=1 Tax=Mameliella sp. TaxID=1924940 RepID=UPI003B50174E
MSTQRTHDTADLLLGAHECLMADDLAGADAAIQQVFRRDPTNLKARALFGLCAARAGDPETARQNAEWVLAQAPDDAIAGRTLDLLRQRTAPAQSAGPVRAAGAARPAPKHQKPSRTGPGWLRSIIFVLLGAMIFPVLFIVAVNLTSELHGGYIRESDIGGLILVLVVVGGVIGRWLAGRGRRAAPRGQVRTVKRAGSGFIRGLFRTILWLALLAGGAFAGWFVASGGGREPDAGVIGAIVGLLISQAIQVVLTPRRR